MGTNYYLRRVKPREVHDLMHICKLSYGWRVHFQDSTEGYADPHDDAPEHPEFHSAREIRALIDSGEWQVADEYGEVWAPGDESLVKLDELLAWNGGGKFQDRDPSRSYPDGEPPYDPDPDRPSEYRDADGYRFDSRWYR